MHTAVDDAGLSLALVVSLAWACLPQPPDHDETPTSDNTTETARCTEWYADRDDDGFGDPAIARGGCDAEPGWVLDATDCFDGNADARPDQSAYFAVDRGDGSFDYDCDGEPTPADTDLGGCLLAATCVPDPGWRYGVAGCGHYDDYFTDCKAQKEVAFCQSTLEARLQRCK